MYIGFNVPLHCRYCQVYYQNTTMFRFERHPYHYGYNHANLNLWMMKVPLCQAHFLLAIDCYGRLSYHQATTATCLVISLKRKYVPPTLRYYLENPPAQ